MVVSISETVSPLACAVSSEHCSPRFKAEFLFLNRLEQSWGYRRKKKKERRKGGRKEEDRKRERKKKEGRKETNLEITHSLIASAIWVIKEKKKKKEAPQPSAEENHWAPVWKKKNMYVCVCVCVCFPNRNKANSPKLCNHICNTLISYSFYEVISHTQNFVYLNHLIRWGRSRNILPVL